MNSISDLVSNNGLTEDSRGDIVQNIRLVDNQYVVLTKK